MCTMQYSSCVDAWFGPEERLTCCDVSAAIRHCSPAFSHIQGLPFGWTPLVSQRLVTKHHTVDI